MLFNGWRQPEYIEEQLKAHGFKDIEVVVSPNVLLVEDPAAFAAQFAGLLLQIISFKFWSADDREKYGPLFPAALVKHLTEKQSEGKPIEIEMTPIIATGRKP
jgi:hypothetical protein